MRIDPIKNGIVIDHIEAGKGMTVYNFLNLGDLNCTVALIKNVPSKKTGKKDIIKIDADVVIDFKVLGYIAPEVTVNIIKDGNSVEKKKLELPQEVKNVIKCKNPRCITTGEHQQQCLSSHIRTIPSALESHQISREYSRVAGCYRRWGITPRPEDTLYFSTPPIECQEFSFGTCSSVDFVVY